MAETFQSMGHHVTVLTGFPNWPSGNIYPGYHLSIKKKEIIEGVPIVRVPLYPDHSDSAKKRIANYTSFVASASMLGPLFIERPDIIHSIQPPTTCLAAWWLSNFWNVPFTHEIQDIWPETLAATEMIRNQHILALVNHYCNFVYKKASALRVISPGFRQNLLKKGVPTGKIHVIQNWVDSQFYRPIAPDKEFADRFGTVGKFNIVYAGAIGLAQGLRTVIDAAERLVDIPNLQFLFFGEGIELSRLISEVHRKSINNVKFLGRYPMEVMNRVYSIADVLLIHLRNDPLFQITIPHKTMTYLASGKPILAAVEGDVADIIRETKAGITCQSGNPNDLANAIRILYTMPLEKRRKLGENGRGAACQRFERTALIGQLVRMFEMVSLSKRN
jgi:colanic acid biosynthesis glycosyl transferase WcaI